MYSTVCASLYLSIFMYTSMYLCVYMSPCLRLRASREQLDQGGLARAVAAHEREARARRDVEGHALDGVLLRAGVPEPDLLEAHAVVGLWPFQQRPARSRHLVVQELVEVREV